MHSSTATGPTRPGLGDDIDALIDRWRQGDAPALHSIFDTNYEHLVSSARFLLAGERRNVYQPMELVHEAFLEIAQRREVTIHDPQHFSRYAQRCMRHFLMGRARSLRATRRGGGHEGLPMSEALDVADPRFDTAQRAELLDLLDSLRRHDVEQWKVVDLHCRCGCTFAEIGKMVQRSERTVKRQWSAARQWIRRQLDEMSLRRADDSAPS